MTPYIHAIRALTSLTFRRIFIPIAIILACVAIALLVLNGFLGSQVSAWWFLLYLLLIPLIAIGLGLGTFAWFISGRLLPRQLSPSEQATLRQFSNKIIHLAEVRSTPLPILGMILAKDIMLRKKGGYIESLIGDSRTLHSDFQHVVNLFR